MNGSPKVPIGNICDRATEAFDPRVWPSDTFRYIDISSIDSALKCIVSPKTLPVKDAPSRAQQVVRAGDILVATTRPNLNAVALVPQDLDGAIASTGFCVLRPTSAVDAGYLFAFVCSRSFVTSLTSLTQGALYPGVSDKQVRAQEIPLPSLDEQTRIARRAKETLQSAERARAAAELQEREVEMLQQSIYRSAFFGVTPLAENDVHDAPPVTWGWHALGELARLESGHTPSRRHPEWWNGEIHWIALPDIRANDGKVIDRTIERTNELGIANSAARVLPKDTVVLSRTASVGFVTVMGRPMATSQDFVNWVCGPELNPFFLMHLLRASRRYLFTLASGAIHKTVYFPTVKALRVCVPSRSVQDRIAADLELQFTTLETLKAKVAKQRNAIEALPAAVLRQAFSGGL